MKYKSLFPLSHSLSDVEWLQMGICHNQIESHIQTPGMEGPSPLNHPFIPLCLF